MKDSEPWAKIQKHESQFRSKEYEVKTAELLWVTNKMMTKENEGLPNNYEHWPHPNNDNTAQNIPEEEDYTWDNSPIQYILLQNSN